MPRQLLTSSEMSARRSATVGFCLCWPAVRNGSRKGAKGGRAWGLSILTQTSHDQDRRPAVGGGWQCGERGIAHGKRGWGRARVKGFARKSVLKQGEWDALGLPGKDRTNSTKRGG